MSTRGALKGLGEGLLVVGRDVMQNMLSQQRDEAAATMRHEYGIAEADYENKLATGRDETKFGREKEMENMRQTGDMARVEKEAGYRSKESAAARAAAATEGAADRASRERVAGMREAGKTPLEMYQALKLEYAKQQDIAGKPALTEAQIEEKARTLSGYSPEAPKQPAANAFPGLLAGAQQPEPSNYVETQDPYQVGKTYPGKDGSRARYLGNGKWQKL